MTAWANFRSTPCSMPANSRGRLSASLLSKCWGLKDREGIRAMCGTSVSGTSVSCANAAMLPGE
eukprot:6492250-Amphidinium_carterae.1